MLLEDELGTINLIVPPPVYERHRLAVRTEPLVVAEGGLERFASGGGAVNVLVRRIARARGARARRSRSVTRDLARRRARQRVAARGEESRRSPAAPDSGPWRRPSCPLPRDGVADAGALARLQCWTCPMPVLVAGR